MNKYVNENQLNFFEIIDPNEQREQFFEELLDSLSIKDRDFIILCHSETGGRELNLAAISRLLNVSRVMTRKRYLRILKKLHIQARKLIAEWFLETTHQIISPPVAPDVDTNS